MRHLFFIATLLMICSAPAGAQQVYRWVDDKGRTHFGAQPPQGIQATRIDSKAPQKSGSTATTASSAVSGSNRPLAADDAEQQALDKQVKDEVMAQEAERVEFCKQTRMDLAQLRNNPRLGYTDEAGKTHILDEKQRQQRIADAERSIAEICRR